MPEQTENRNEFEPDREFETHFSWEDVIACLNNKLESGKFTGHSITENADLNLKN